MRPALLAFTFTCSLLAQHPFQVRVVGTGQPMILIPGLSSSGETWDTTVAHYKDRFECHILTLAGFAGVPRVPAPMLDRVRDGLANYIGKNQLEKPVIVGHSLGGFLALDFAITYPDVASQLVIVDSYAFYAGIGDPNATLAQAKTTAKQISQGMGQMSQEAYEAYVKSGAGDRTMVTSDSDFERLVTWGLASDRIVRDTATKDPPPLTHTIRLPTQNPPKTPKSTRNQNRRIQKQRGEQNEAAQEFERRENKLTKILATGCQPGRKSATVLQTGIASPVRR